MTDKTIGKRIKERRMQLHLSQTRLAEMAGYTDKTAISKIENGRSDLTQSKIALFAEVLQTTPRYLMGWVDTVSPNEEKLLACYRTLSEPQQEAVLKMLESMKGD